MVPLVFFRTIRLDEILCRLIVYRPGSLFVPFLHFPLFLSPLPLSLRLRCYPRVRLFPDFRCAREAFARQAVVSSGVDRRCPGARRAAQQDRGCFVFLVSGERHMCPRRRINASSRQEGGGGRPFLATPRCRFSCFTRGCVDILREVCSLVLQCEKSGAL